MTDSKPAYAVGYLRGVDFGADIIQYMRETDATLLPFGGEFIVHGGDLCAREGVWDGDLVVIRFPDRESADGWYDSADYQRIVPLRQRNSSSIVAIVDGVAPGHTAARKADDLLAAMGLLG